MKKKFYALISLSLTVMILIFTLSSCAFIENILGDSSDDTPRCEHEWSDGVCTLCRKECQHNYVLDNQCTVCGKEKPTITLCEHEWEDQKCVKCGTYCRHLFKDSTCSYCGFVCTHESLWYGGKCQACGVLCEHEWDHASDYYGLCVKCGHYCTHDSMTDGAGYVDGTCTYCLKVCNHPKWKNGICRICGSACQHEWNDSYCEICDTSCDHKGTHADGVCSVCGGVCKHKWNGYVCQKCDMYCEHSFDGAVCVSCGYTSYGIDNPLAVTYKGTLYKVPYSTSLYGFLSTCLGVDYYESIEDGYWVVIGDRGDVEIESYTSLSTFGEAMTIAYRVKNDGCQNHVFFEGICLVCEAKCTHTNTYNGYCTVCDSACPHESYVDGVCDNCGIECNHTFVNGVCTRCGVDVLDSNITVKICYESQYYEVRGGMTLYEFVTDVLKLNYNLLASLGVWTVRLNGKLVSITADTSFATYDCDVIYLDYTFH